MSKDKVISLIKGDLEYLGPVMSATLNLRLSKPRLKCITLFSSGLNYR